MGDPWVEEVGVCLRETIPPMGLSNNSPPLGASEKQIILKKKFSNSKKVRIFAIQFKKLKFY